MLRFIALIRWYSIFDTLRQTCFKACFLIAFVFVFIFIRSTFYIKNSHIKEWNQNYLIFILFSSYDLSIKMVKNWVSNWKRLSWVEPKNGWFHWVWSSNWFWWDVMLTWGIRSKILLLINSLKFPINMVMVIMFYIITINR